MSFVAMMKSRSAAVLGLLSALMACGGSGTFSPTFPDNQASDVDAVLARLQATQAAPVEAVAAGVTVSPPALFVFDLETGAERWQVQTGTAASAPIVAGNLVLLHQDRGVVAYDLEDGSEEFVVEDEAMYLTGAGGDGDLVAFALSTGGGVGARSQLIIAEGGRVKHHQRFDQTLGAPAVGGTMVFVPWATQNLSVMDSVTGDEMARIRVTDTPVGWTSYDGGNVYFGQAGIFRFQPSSASGSAASGAFTRPLERDLPGEPSLVTDPYTPAPGAASAIHKIRLDWRPGGAGETMSFGDDRLYATFYRLVFGLPPDEDGVHFVYAHPEDIVGAQALEGGLLVADEAGGLAFVDTEGSQRWSGSLGRQATSVHIRANGFVPPLSPASASSTLEQQLTSAAENADSRLVPARRFAIHLMGALEGAEVTGNLLGICEDARAPAPIRAEACASLAGRTSGAPAVLSALQRRYDYIANTTPAPLGALASAAVGMQARAAAPLLLQHLQDPHTPAGDLGMIAEALAILGSSEIVDELRAWLQLYHVAASDEPTADGLGKVATALFALDPENTEALVTELAAAPLASDIARIRLQQALESWREAQAADEADEEEADAPDETDADTESEAAPEADPNAPVETTTLAVAMRVLEPVAPRLRACISSDQGHAQSARVALVLNGDGSIRSLSTTPARLGACVEPLIRSQPFPGNSRDVREQLTLTFRR